MRSTLTTLGIVIGVAAVIANVSLGASFNRFFTDEIGTIGSNFIVISGKEPDLLFDTEMDLIKNTPGISGVSPIKQLTAQVAYLSRSRHISVVGVSKDYLDAANLKMEDGSFLNDKDGNVAVIGHDVAYDKFDRNVSTQNSIEITFKKKDGSLVTRKFNVKGVLSGQEITVIKTGIERDKLIFIPISTMNEILGENDYGTLFAMATSLGEVETINDRVDKRLARHFGVSSRDFDNEDAKPYSMLNQAEILKEVDNVSGALSALLAAVALISLVVGSIGIMNIMLVTVTERTREIGIMKSLGFTNFDILSLFIVESVVLSVFGGMIGMGLGVLAAYGAESMMKLPYVFPVAMIAVGFGVSVLVGLVAGMYPANKAAKMNPVEALRHE